MGRLIGKFDLSQSASLSMKHITLAFMKALYNGLMDHYLSNCLTP